MNYNIFHKFFRDSFSKQEEETSRNKNLFSLEIHHFTVHTHTLCLFMFERGTEMNVESGELCVFFFDK